MRTARSEIPLIHLEASKENNLELGKFALEPIVRAMALLKTVAKAVMASSSHMNHDDFIRVWTQVDDIAYSLDEVTK